VSQLGGLTTNVRDALTWIDAANPASPNTFFRNNQPRIGLYDSASDSGQPALATGVMTAVRIKLFAGDVITNISFRSGQTAAGTPTNYWVALYSAAGTPALLAQSADQTSTAWAANTTKTLALATAQTISTTGFYWAALNVTATTPPSLIGSGGVAPIVTGEANLSVSSGSSLTATATATLASPAFKSFTPYVVLT
jgi:hypothetical protein